ncbi:hypothetical protein O3P69_000061 [Scylla paramamosain]|uniref:PEST proteolytic signal-containing nuclear protein n=1 Tax=Scylla paramamosain TaxID=85552 RepID=A0AAW0UVH8_SCYPA
MLRCLMCSLPPSSHGFLYLTFASVYLQRRHWRTRGRLPPSGQWRRRGKGRGRRSLRKSLVLASAANLRGSLSFPVKKPSGGISIKLGQSQKAASQAGGTASLLKPKVGAAAAAFSTGDDDDDEEEEEMPPEAKMRMKNIGRDTPTSAGPNSFGKTRMGFCDSKKIYEKQLKEVQDKANKVVPDSV